MKKWNSSVTLSLVSKCPTWRHKKIQDSASSDTWAGEGGKYGFAKFKKNACVFVPKAFKFSRTVASQLRTGWEAGRYGIPEDIVAQTDRAVRSLSCANQHDLLNFLILERHYDGLYYHIMKGNAAAECMSEKYRYH